MNTQPVPVPSKAEIIARAMAAKGRNGDNQVVHAKTGEVVVPREVLEQNPDLAINLLRAFRASGGDPSRYVVGSPDNSINPETGQPEFFWKDLLGIVAPAAVGTYFPEFGNLGMGLTAAATNKLTGGSWGEALASGAGSFIGGTIADKLAGDGTTLAGYFDEGGDGFLSNAGSMIGDLRADAVGGGLGSYAGSQLYGMYQDYVNPAQAAPLNIPKLASYETSKSGKPTLAMPNQAASQAQANQTPIPAPADPGASIPLGVSFAAPVKDRTTGRTRYMSLDDEEEERRRAYSWGNTISL